MPVARVVFFLVQEVALCSAAETVQQLHARIPMRDGVRLAANIFRPGTPARVPSVLVRTPYGKGEAIGVHYQTFVDHGYAIVAQDVRGRYESEGVFAPLRQEPADGDDTLNWIAKQPWSDGNIGMMGGSYLGICQWKAATLNNPHLKAIFPAFCGDDDYRDRFYSTGGAMKLGSRLLWISQNLRAPEYRPPDFSSFIWTLPLRRADIVTTGAQSEMYREALDHPADDAFWQSMSTRRKLGNVRVPVFSVGGWYDNFVESDLDAFAILNKKKDRNRILIGPWPHNMSVRLTGGNFGPNWLVPLRKTQIEWFDRWLKNGLKSKDAALDSKPPVRIFVMGANIWRDEREWPLRRARAVRFYLATGVLALKPAERSAPDHFVYDPRNPVPTAGGAVCCDPKIFPWGPMDQRAVEKRRDVLVYTTPPLREDLEVTGPIRVVLYASTSAVDTDFTAKLVDVLPGRLARNLTDGILRARYRDSLESPALLEPGKIYKLMIDGGVTSNVFRQGHGLRLEISSSNFPRFDRNLNTGGPIADGTEMRKAAQTVFHDRAHPSYILLPVVPDSHSAPSQSLTSTRPARYFPDRSSTRAR
ncbi:MAG: CocE/NonD family hydrolase [Bryobacteraceae bacterium]